MSALKEIILTSSLLQYVLGVSDQTLTFLGQLLNACAHLDLIWLLPRYFVSVTSIEERGLRKICLWKISIRLWVSINSTTGQLLIVRHHAAIPGGLVHGCKLLAAFEAVHSCW